MPFLRPLYQWGIRLMVLALVFHCTNLLMKRWETKLIPYFRETDQELMAMRAMVNITLDIVSDLDETKVLQNINIRAAELINAPFCCLSLYDPLIKGMRMETQLPYKVTLAGQVFRPGEGVIGTVLASGKPVIVNDYKSWEKNIKVNLLPLNCFIGIPLIWKGQVIGSLTIGDEDSRRIFHPTDAIKLQPFADLATIAINNSKMYSEIKNFSRELEQRDADKTVQLQMTRNELIQKTIQLQGLLKRLTKAQESERGRISRDMHDSTTQLILAAVYATQAVMDGMGTDPELSKTQLQTVQMLLHQIEIEIRETIRNLRPIILDQEGIAVAIQQYVERFSLLSNLKCHFSIQGNPARLSDEFEVTIYRIVQEALQNITAHAQATNVSVELEFQQDLILINIRDDGVGFEITKEFMQDEAHYGLAGMQERAEIIGASLFISSQPGKGTLITLKVPCNA